MTNIKSLKIILYILVSMHLFACGGSSSDAGSPPASVLPTPTPTNPTPVPPTVTGLPQLQTQGTLWVNSDGTRVTLKGINLGNWLLQEFWMMNQSSNTEATDQCRLEAVLDERFGFDERERLMDLFRDNWIRERDWDIMQSFGFNVIRLPFIWNLIEDENKPMTLRQDAWQYIDYAISRAEENGMYVILDLHGAVGAQGFQDHSGCAGKNQYWEIQEYQERTTWLWKEIANRYKNNGTVAAYGLLNEPWGTDARNLANVMLALHDEVRAVDPDKIIVLPGHNSGIDEYGSPEAFEGNNVAFEMHFYPGIFGWGEPNYETHRDWLTCSPNGSLGVCEWDERMKSINAPLLIGEFQPWANLGLEFGAENARATYDKYAYLNWAATSWSYKVLNSSGGQGQGTWGIVTNKPNSLGLIAKSSSWVCPGWDSKLEDACEIPAKKVSSDTSGTSTFYLLVKFGTCCEGKLDTSLDSLSLKDEEGNELIANGDFGSSSNWTTWYASDSPSFDFNYVDNTTVPAGASGPVLRMTGTTNASATEINGGIYQAITLDGEKNYTLSGVFKDNGGSNTWAEIYIVREKPIDGKDVVEEELVPSVDFATAPMADIESVFTLYGTVEYEIHEALRQALTSELPSTLYTLPLPPQGLSVAKVDTKNVLSWNANNESDITGYNVYRRDGSASAFSLIAENINTLVYEDNDIQENTNYYYKIAAVDTQDISYSSEEIVSSSSVMLVPGLIQAENWTMMSGFELEMTTDDGDGSNLAFADAGDWIEYQINITQAGNYRVDYRLASLTGSSGFTLLLDGTVIDTVTVPATGGWQTWMTQSQTIDLPAGRYVLRIDAIDKEWNLNWIKFSVN